MERILGDLNKAAGIQGSIIIGKDGIVIASELLDEMDEEMVSALGSSIILSSEKVAEKMQHGNVVSILIETDKSKWCIHRISIGYLIAIAHTDVNLGLLRVEIRDAALKIDNKSIGM